MLFTILAALFAADQPVLNYIPKHEELKYTFGGVAPTHHVKPGTRIVSWTEDCYDGAVTRPDQLPTKVIPPGHDNPQTGPFFIDGAEPGDTIAIHINKLEPARDHGISSFFPGFGALNGTDRTAILGADLPEKVWFYDVDPVKGVARTKTRPALPSKRWSTGSKRRPASPRWTPTNSSPRTPKPRSCRWSIRSTR